MDDSLRRVVKRQEQLEQIMAAMSSLAADIYEMDSRHSGVFSNSRQCAIHHIREAVDALAVADEDLEAEIAERVMNGEDDPRGNGASEDN